jgi:uncharacterized membrane protein YeaQ/YmgE (transglycosylase-associated protein family)
MMNPFDLYAMYEMEHLLVGVFGTLILLYLTKLTFGKMEPRASYYGVLVWSVMWELYQKLYMVDPLDTIWDITLSMIGAYLAVKLISRFSHKYSEGKEVGKWGLRR